MTAPYPIDRIRKDFPILQREVNGQPLVYLDNGASTQKPSSVIQAIADYYTDYNSNIHRGVHHLSQLATDAYEVSRQKIAQFIGAPDPRQVLFTSGTTGGINLVAHSFGKAFVQAGDEILISEMEHHSNIVPWQIMCEDRGAVLKVIPMTESGELDMAQFSKLLGPKTKLVSLVYVSNSLGTINPAKKIIEEAHAQNVPVLLDAAQAVQHIPLDVQALDVDFLVFSGHKLYGPTGVGVLYAKENWLERMPPYQGGGDMIKTVTFEKTVYNELPFKFEAGTPNIAGGVGLGYAIDYVNSIGLKDIASYEQELLDYMNERLLTIPGLRFIGTSPHKAATASFLIGDVHPYDVGVILDKLGIAVRTGHHCTQPIMDKFGIPGTVRASLGMYNTRADVDRLVSALERAAAMLM